LKKVTLIVLSLLISISLSSSQVLAQPKDVQGWNKARWNMTEDEVKKSFEGKPVSSNAPKGYWDTVLRTLGTLIHTVHCT
jgi:hypothetical protein